VPDRRGGGWGNGRFRSPEGGMAAAGGQERPGGGAKPLRGRLAGGLEAAGPGGFKGLCSEMEHGPVLHSGTGAGRRGRGFGGIASISAAEEQGGLRVEVSHPFARKKAKGWGTQCALRMTGKQLPFGFAQDRLSTSLCSE
jgi:hypothetical protein